MTSNAPEAALTLPQELLQPSATHRLSARDGLGLHTAWYAPSHARATCVIAHGYAEHGGRYGELVTLLVEQGIAVMTFDFRGHGRSEGQRGHVLRFQEYVADLATAAECALQHYAGPLPLVGIAHSNGALAALGQLSDPQRAQPEWAAMVLSSPFLRLRLAVPRIKRALGEIASRIAPRVSLPNGLDPNDFTRDPEKVAERERDTLCHGVAGTRWFTEAMAAQNDVMSRAHLVKTPTLWVVGGSDPIADPAASRELVGRLQSPAVLREFPEMRHEVFNEMGREAVFAEVLAYLGERI